MKNKYEFNKRQLSPRLQKGGKKVNCSVNLPAPSLFPNHQSPVLPQAVLEFISSSKDAKDGEGRPRESDLPKVREVVAELR